MRGFASLAFALVLLSASCGHVARPEGRVHFAGEHTSVFAASMNGALESGQRAAGEILERA